MFKNRKGDHYTLEKSKSLANHNLVVFGRLLKTCSQDLVEVFFRGG